MSNGVYTNTGCVPAWYAAGADCQAYGTSFTTGSGNNVITNTYLCTGYSTNAQGTGYTLTTQRCPQTGACVNTPSVTRSLSPCTIGEFNFSPLNLSLSEGGVLSGLILLVWACAFAYKSMAKTLDGAPEN
jgi:hypothetical protein